MDGMMEKMQSLLSDPESMQQLQELAQMLQADSGQESTETESAPTATEQTDAAASGGGLDLGALMKVSQLMGSAKEDSDAALLLALKDIGTQLGNAKESGKGSKDAETAVDLEHVERKRHAERFLVMILHRGGAAAGKGANGRCRNIPDRTAMQCGRMPFAVLKRCTIGQRFRNQRRSETMIFYRCERNQGQLLAA